MILKIQNIDYKLKIKMELTDLQKEWLKNEKIRQEEYRKRGEKFNRLAKMINVREFINEKGFWINIGLSIPTTGYIFMKCHKKFNYPKAIIFGPFVALSSYGLIEGSKEILNYKIQNFKI